MSATLLSISKPAPARTATPTILDKVLPSYDATRVEKRVVRASRSAVYEATIAFDFLTVPRRHLATRALFSIRSAIEEVLDALRIRSRSSVIDGATMRIRDLPFTGDWVQLGADCPREFTFGAVGRFWSGETNWVPIAATEFARFKKAGYAKIACHFQLEELESGYTLLTYEARTRATDDTSREAFLRYWRLVTPLVGIIMRATLADIAREVEVNL